MTARPEPNREAIKVERTAHFASFGDPGSGTDRLWLVFHGYRQLAHRFIRGFAGLASGDRAVVAPEGLSRFYVRSEGAGTVGASWMTREDRLTEIEDYLGYLDSLWSFLQNQRGISPAELTLLGFSQGVATAFRWAARGSASPGRIVAWGSFPPPDLVDRDYRRLVELGTRVSLVVGAEDRFTPVAGMKEVADQYRERGLEVELIVFPGGHEIDPSTVARLAES